jgi:hypothetical protein
MSEDGGRRIGRDYRVRYLPRSQSITDWPGLFAGKARAKIHFTTADLLLFAKS